MPVTNSTIAAAAFSGNRRKPFNAGLVTSTFHGAWSGSSASVAPRQSELAAEITAAGRIAVRDVARAFQVFANGRPGKSMNCFLQRLQVRRGHQDCRRVSMAGDLDDLVRLVGFLHQSGKFVLGFAERHRSRSTFIARKQARL